MIAGDPKAGCSIGDEFVDESQTGITFYTQNISMIQAMGRLRRSL
jgi:hypothetical protein